jgi:hypothetical protein
MVLMLKAKLKLWNVSECDGKTICILKITVERRCRMF